MAPPVAIEHASGLPIRRANSAQPIPQRSWPARAAGRVGQGGLIGLVLLDVVAGETPLRLVWWVAAVWLAGAASLLGLVAAEHRGAHEARRWQVQAVAGAVLMLALMARGSAVDPVEPIASGALLVVAWTLVAIAVSRFSGPARTTDTIRLLVDNAILAIGPTLAATAIFADATTLKPTFAALAGSFGAAAYSIGYACLGAARRQPRGADALLITGVILLSIYAAGHAAEAAGLPMLAGLSAPGVALVAAGVFARSAWKGTVAPGVAGRAEAPEYSRLRLMPALAAGLVIVVLSLAELRGEGSRAGFFGVITLFGLIVARLVFTLLENRQLLQRVEHSGEFEERLRDLSETLRSVADRGEALGLIAQTAQASFGAHSVLIWMVDAANEELEAVEVLGTKRQSLVTRRIPLSDSTSLAARVARTGQAEIISQVPLSDESSRFLNVLLHTQSLMAVPISRAGVVQGVLVCSDAHDTSAYGLRERAQAELLASHVAVALESAYHQEQQRRRLDEVTAMHHFALALHSAVKPIEVAQQLLPVLKERVRYTYAAVWLRDPRRGTLWLAAGDSPGGVPLAGVLPSDLAYRAFNSGDPSRAGLGWDIESEYAPPRRAIRSQLAVPIVLNQRAVGVLDLESRQPNAYSRHDERLVVSLANQAGLALENLHLREDAREIQALKELDRMKSDLLSTVSHELRTPLSSIKGYASTLLAHENKLRREEKREFLEIIDSEADRLRELIENLLDLSRMEAGVLHMECAPARLGKVVAEVARKVQLSTDTHQVEVSWPDDRDVMADARRLYQVIQNLVTNAVKYSPEGGRIVIGGQFTSRELVVSVRDEGLGLPADEIDRIFDRFHRVAGEASTRIGGTGLGLAICKAFVDAHGGRIWAESEGEGRGSTFRFALPLAS